MRTWLALLAAPSVALACQAILFALVTPSCAAQTRLLLHGVAGASFVLALLFSLLARGEWLALAADVAPVGPDSDRNDPVTPRRFLAIAATAVGTLSSLTILAMWMAVWVLSPCWS